jgi:hypothetical protein
LFEQVKTARPDWTLSQQLQEAGRLEAEARANIGTAAQGNGSGESAASVEAINRASSEKAQGIKRVVIDTRSGAERPLIGADAVDYQPRPYESVEFRGGARDGEVMTKVGKHGHTRGEMPR